MVLMSQLLWNHI